MFIIFDTVKILYVYDMFHILLSCYNLWIHAMNEWYVCTVIYWLQDVFL